jgi:predicted nucleic acid-binding protein
MAARVLGRRVELLVADLIVAETIYVLEVLLRSATTTDRRGDAVAARVRVRGHRRPRDVLRAIEVYELDRLDFAEFYLVAAAEASGVARIASFDRAIDRATSVERVEPARP